MCSTEVLCCGLKVWATLPPHSELETLSPDVMVFFGAAAAAAGWGAGVRFGSQLDLNEILGVEFGSLKEEEERPELSFSLSGEDKARSWPSISQEEGSF